MQVGSQYLSTHMAHSGLRLPAVQSVIPEDGLFKRLFAWRDRATDRVMYRGVSSELFAAFGTRDMDRLPLLKEPP